MKKGLKFQLTHLRIQFNEIKIKMRNINMQFVFNPFIIFKNYMSIGGLFRRTFDKCLPI